MPDRRDDSLGASDFELVEKMGNDLLLLMAQGIPEHELRELLTSALGVISNLRSFATVQALLNPENVVPKSGMLSTEQLKNLFKHLSSLSINLSATQKPLRQDGPTIGPDDKTLRIPAHKSDPDIAEQFFSQARLEYQRNNYWRAKESANRRFQKIRETANITLFTGCVVRIISVSIRKPKNHS